MGWSIDVCVAEDPLKVEGQENQDRVVEWLDANGWSAWFDGDVLEIEHENEHTPFVQPEFMQILSEVGAKGDFLYGSMDGDNSGENWGYRFTGLGGWRELEGVLVWKEK
jgi:hypothetical protein